MRHKTVPYMERYFVSQSAHAEGPAIFISLSTAASCWCNGLFIRRVYCLNAAIFLRDLARNLMRRYFSGSLHVDLDTLMFRCTTIRRLSAMPPSAINSIAPDDDDTARCTMPPIYRRLSAANSRPIYIGFADAVRHADGLMIFTTPHLIILSIYAAAMRFSFNIAFAEMAPPPDALK